ncbi:MAG: VCBS repeat-containing protein [Saprospiraceae bacterium]|nr:VCBS repeat-containing protein [Saprospiraceae bacterium]
MKKTILFLSVLCLFAACKNEKTLFVLLDSSKTGIDFNNQITETDSLTIFNSEFIYNGGGVGIGDLNGDGLQDLYFTGNQVENKLYLNKGNLQFQEATAQANVQKEPNQWSSGINMLDINRDGKLDMYICNTFKNKPELRKNLLFINQGNDVKGIPHFKEMAKEYGLDDTTHASNAQFFDYDNDGDLDVFIAVNYMDTKYPNQYFPKVKDGSSPNTDRLLQNNLDPSVNHPVFTDISKKAGIKLEGYSHSSLITDFNNDGWLDIYVANDYVTNDLIYINNHDGTFTNQVAAIFKHQAASAMGSDVADVNNDGKLDVFTTEMMPYHNKRKKVFLNANNYNNYINNESYGFEYQYARNVLQLNRGLNPETGLPTFSDIAFIGDVQETEWSWTPLMADFDNDGNRDIFVTNGFPRDVTDHDFGAYRSTVSYLIPEVELQKTIPQIKVPKFLFRNEGDLRFKDVSKEWGVAVSAFSNGAAYGDLDNDGDLDLIVNNINDKAFVFQNTVNDSDKKSNYLRLKIEGEQPNTDAFGATATVFFGGKQQIAQLVSARGYISTSENCLHFGLGTATKVDSVIVKWQGGKTAKLGLQAINQMITVKFGQNTPFTEGGSLALFDDLNPKTFGLDFIHRDSDFIDFNYQKTLPHKFSEYGPSVSVGDVNGDGRDDIYVGGSALFDGTWFLQNANGQFSKKSVSYKLDPKKQEEELGTLLFDADNDGDNDLYIVHGSSQYPPNSPFYQDVLCINDGKGNFKIAQNALPTETSCGQTVKAADFDGDGDLDLFVGARVLPFAYPKTDRSFLLRNDSKGKDKPVFTDVTQEVCPELAQIGMISDALWTDFNGDNQPDLLLAGEWMPLTFLQNDHGKLKNATANSGIGDKIGWWTSLTAADFDNDGDVDYMAGNFGENLYFKCSSGEPLSIYAKDFDNNGLYDPFISCFWRDTAGQRKEFFYHTRDDMVKQLVLIRRKFLTYGDFGKATVQDVFSQKELEGAQIFKSNWLSTSYLENIGGGKFKISALPTTAQLAPIYGMMPFDVDKDGLLDLVMVGNDYGMELLQGRADAFDGLVLKNMGQNQFKTIELDNSHFYVPNNARALTQVVVKDKSLLLATQNKGALKAFALKNSAHIQNIPLSKNEVKAQVLLKNGQKQMKEFYWGSTFLSQEGRSFPLDETMQEVIFYDAKNNVTRKVSAKIVQ